MVEPTPEPEPTDPETTDPETTEPDPNSEDAEGDTTPADTEEVPSPQNLLLAIRDSKNMSMRVNFLQIAVETASNPGFTNKINVEEQISFRKELLDEIEKQVIDF